HTSSRLYGRWAHHSGPRRGKERLHSPAPDTQALPAWGLYAVKCKHMHNLMIDRKPNFLFPPEIDFPSQTWCNQWFCGCQTVRGGSPENAACVPFGDFQQTSGTV